MRLTDTDRQQLRHLQKLGLVLRHVYDVGASNGRWSSRVSQDFPDTTFDLFEPLIDIAPEYQRNMAATLRAHPHFRLHKVALGPQCQSTVMYWYPENTVGSTALELESTPPTAKAVEVTMLTLDYAVQEFRLPVPQVIKMDTQGCELGILSGARETLPQVSVLLLECWLSRAYGKPTPLLLEVAEWLRGFDFHFWDFGNGWRNEEGTLIAQDCLFINARSKISRLQGELSRSLQSEPEVPHLESQRPLWLERMRNILWHH